MAADRKAVESTTVAAMKLRVAVGLLFALCASIALYVLAPRRRRRTRRVAEAPAMPVARPVGTDERGDESHLQEAVRRMAERRQAVAVATAQVAERNRQQVALLQEKPAAAPALTVIRGQSQVSRTPVNTSYQLGKRALVGA
jgi:hypothetical protein